MESSNLFSEKDAPRTDYSLEYIDPETSVLDGLPKDVAFDVLASGGHSTVCSTAPIMERKSESYQTEAQLEDAFIKQLQRQAYEYITPESEDALVANIRTQLEKLNNYQFSDDEWKRFFATSISSANEGIVEKTRRIQEDYVQTLKRDDGSSKNIKLIDKKNVHNNHLQVMNQFTQEGSYENRYDVTILCNGLPLVHVELKKRGVSIKEAFNQIERYQRDSFWSGSGLFEYVQVFVISNGTHTKYYSNTTRFSAAEENRGNAIKKGKKTSNSFEFTCWWAAADNMPIQDLVPFTKTFFAKHTLLNILTKYCVFTTEELLLVMRPYQIVATERILNRVLVAENNPSMLGTTQAGGYIWHTTGSGKTLTSFKTARLAAGMEGVDKVLFVVDRKDLDVQTIREFNRFEDGAVDANKTTKVLTKQLNDPGCKILVTTIQKLARFISKNPKHDIYNQHVVIIFDECHRSQFGDMHKAITKHFKKYHLFGFTGTPIFAENSSGHGNPYLRTTEQAFGDKLHTYTIVDAIRDGNVLPFRIDYINTINQRDDYKDEKVRGIYAEGAYQDKRRIDAIVRYILEHFDAKTMRNYSYDLHHRRMRGFNSLFAVSSIEMAKLYYTAFKRIQAESSGENLKIALIYSFGPNEADDGCGLPDESFDVESLDTTSREFLEAAIQDYNALFAVNYSTNTGPDGFQDYYKDLSQRLKERELDMAIVVNMFLTGFDATTLNTLWVDKNLKQHGLIQAFSRTNRILNSVKTFGNVVCFRDLEDEVNEAISLFGDENASGVVLLRPYAEYLAEYQRKIAEIQERFPLGQLIVGERNEKDFIRLFGSILRLRNILGCFDEFPKDDVLPARDLQDYQSIYRDLLDKYRPKKDHAIINDDLVFEIELLKQVDINIDYILALVQKYHDANCRDKEIVADINRALGASYTLHSKKDLIEAFIASLKHTSNVYEEWQEFVKRKKEEELSKIIADEHLNPEGARELIDRAFRDGGVPENGDEVSSLMLKKPSRFAPSNDYVAVKERVIDRLKSFYERFRNL